MRLSLILQAWLVLICPLAAQDAVPVKEFVVHLRLFEGNPNGSVEEGTIRVVAAPPISVCANQTFVFKSGRDAAILDSAKTKHRRFYGRIILGEITPLRNGTVTVDFAIETILPQMSRHRGRAVLDTLSITSTQSMVQGKLNEVLRMSPPPGARVWADIKVAGANSK